MILGFLFLFLGGCRRENCLSAYLDHVRYGTGACIFRSEVYDYRIWLRSTKYNFGDDEDEINDDKKKQDGREVKKKWG